MATFDRFQYEQQAATYLSKGQTEKALQTYMAILRHDPRDVRIRQKIAELYARTGRTREADKQFREVIRVYNEEGNYRASVAVLKQLRQLFPQDPELLAELADATYQAGFPNEAEPLFELAIKQLERPKPALAADYAEKLLRLRPGDTPLRLKRADFLRRAKQFNRAYFAYMEIIQDMRRWGRATEIGRIAAMALEVKPGDATLLQDAAAAALAEGDTATAFKHLQTAYARNQREPRTLDLLARAFEGGENAAQARPILLSLAELLTEQADHEGRLKALERAAALGRDPDLDAQIALAQQAVQAASFRLYQLPSAAAQSEDVLRGVTRLEVFLRYGLEDKAAEEIGPLESAHADSRAVQAVSAGLAVIRGESERALALAQGLLRGAPAADRAKIELRIRVLNGEDPATIGGGVASAEDDLLDDELDDLLDDEDVLDDPTSPGEASDDLLDDELDDLLDDDELDEMLDEGSGDDDPFTGPERVVIPDPFAVRGDSSFGEILQKGGTLAEINPDEIRIERPRVAAAAPGPSRPEPLRIPCGLMDLGLYEQAKAAVEGSESLGAETIRCFCLAAEGDTRDAMDDLRDAMDDAGDQSPEYPMALFYLAQIAARSGKGRRARRWLEDLKSLSPGYRAAEVERMLEALDSL